MLASVQTHNVFVRVQNNMRLCVSRKHPYHTKLQLPFLNSEGSGGEGFFKEEIWSLLGGYFTIGQVACIVEVVNSLKLPDWLMSLNGPYKILGFDNSWGLIISIIFMILAEFMS